jgi:hypothetical protein
MVILINTLDMDERTTLLQQHFATLLGSQEPALQQLLTDAHILRLPSCRRAGIPRR